MAVVIDHQRELLLGYQEDKILLQGDIFIQLLIHITADAKSTLMLSSIEDSSFTGATIQSSFTSS